MSIQKPDLKILENFARATFWTDSPTKHEMAVDTIRNLGVKNLALLETGLLLKTLERLKDEKIPRDTLVEAFNARWTIVPNKLVPEDQKLILAFLKAHSTDTDLISQLRGIDNLKVAFLTSHPHLLKEHMLTEFFTAENIRQLSKEDFETLVSLLLKAPNADRNLGELFLVRGEDQRGAVESAIDRSIDAIPEPGFFSRLTSIHVDQALSRYEQELLTPEQLLKLSNKIEPHRGGTAEMSALLMRRFDADKEGVIINRYLDLLKGNVSEALRAPLYRHREDIHIDHYTDERVEMILQEATEHDEGIDSKTIPFLAFLRESNSVINYLLAKRPELSIHSITEAVLKTDWDGDGREQSLLNALENERVIAFKEVMQRPLGTYIKLSDLFSENEVRALSQREVELVIRHLAQAKNGGRAIERLYNIRDDKPFILSVLVKEVTASANSEAILNALEGIHDQYQKNKPTYGDWVMDLLKQHRPSEERFALLPSFFSDQQSYFQYLEALEIKETKETPKHLKALLDLYKDENYPHKKRLLEKVLIYSENADNHSINLGRKPLDLIPPGEDWIKAALNSDDPFSRKRCLAFIKSTCEKQTFSTPPRSVLKAIYPKWDVNTTVRWDEWESLDDKYGKTNIE